MRRIRIILIGLAVAVLAVVASAAVLHHGGHRKPYHYVGTRLMVDLARPDALIRTASLVRLPRDLLKVPMVHDVFTEDLAFYYSQHEDRLGIAGAIKRIAYEHEVAWSDRLLANVLDQPAEVALWRDGKGALRHYAIVVRRSTLVKTLQQLGVVALDDRQLKAAGHIDTANGPANLYALEINPRRTLLLVVQGDHLIILSDPGLLFKSGAEPVAAARNALVVWLESEGALSHQFALTDSAQAARPTHTLIVAAPALALGYGAFIPGFKGLRFDFGESWSTFAWIDQTALPKAGLGDAAIWHAAPANPAACVLLPVDWPTLKAVIAEAEDQPTLPKSAVLATLDGPALACWYGNARLDSPVFIARLHGHDKDRDKVLGALAHWAITSFAEDCDAPPPTVTASTAKSATGTEQPTIWRAVDGERHAAGKHDSADPAAPALAAFGDYVVFSPDGALVDLALDTLRHKNPSVADQSATSAATLALITPHRLAALGQREALSALSGAGDAALLAAAQTHLPARMKALASYPPTRLDLSGTSVAQSGWQRLEWRTAGVQP